MFENIRLLRASYQLVRDPNRLDVVFNLADSIAAKADFSDALARLRKSPQASRAIDDQIRLAPITLDVLAAYPEGSLGRVFADFCRAEKLDPCVFFGRPAASDGEYLFSHLYETHDIWHVITGFGTDVAAELGLQAFYLGQFPSQLAMYLLPLGMLNTFLFAKDDYDRRMEAITFGWQLGKSSAPLFGRDWSAEWARPLAEIRAELGITPRRAALAA